MGWGSGQSAHHEEVGASFVGISAGQKPHGNGLHLLNRFGQGLKGSAQGAMKPLAPITPISTSGRRQRRFRR